MPQIRASAQMQGPFTFSCFSQVPRGPSPPFSSGAGDAERGSRRGPSFIRNRHLVPALPAAPGSGSASGWGREHARVPRRQAGNFHKSPVFSRDFISELVIGDGGIKHRPGSSPSPRRDGEPAERAASWRMEITPAAARADSCSGEGRKEAELPMDIRQGNNGRALSGHRCSSEHSLCKAPLFSCPCWEYR